MDVELEKLIDGVWNTALERIAKKQLPVARPSLGDDIDMAVPQTRTLLMMAANPSIASLIYSSAYVSSNRNAYIIMRKLGMPADYFWKFEYWMKQRAFDTLRRVINRVFTAMMKLNKEGGLDVEDVDAEHMRFVLSFNECAECAGMEARRGICFYHAGTFAGIVAALISKDMDAFETKCHAEGNNPCVFVIGKRDDPEISSKMNTYLAPTDMELKIDDRLNACLQGQPLRDMGNLVDVGYYTLVIANSIINNPELFSSSSFDVGVEYGTKLANIITAFYQQNDLGVIRKYYNQLHQLDVKAIEVGDNVEINMAECAELAAMLKRRELLGFLFGELQGLVSKLLNRKMSYKESWFEDSGLRVRLSPQS